VKLNIQLLTTIIRTRAIIVAIIVVARASAAAVLRAALAAMLVFILAAALVASLLGLIISGAKPHLQISVLSAGNLQLHSAARLHLGNFAAELVGRRNPLAVHADNLIAGSQTSFVSRCVLVDLPHDRGV